MHLPSDDGERAVYELTIQCPFHRQHRIVLAGEYVIAQVAATELARFYRSEGYDTEVECIMNYNTRQHDMDIGDWEI